MSVSTTFAFDRNDHYRALRAVTRFTSARWMSWGFTAVALILVAWTAWRDFDPYEPFLWVVTGLPYIVLLLFWACFLPVMQYLGARRVAKRDPSIQGPQERTIDDTGYHSRGNGVSLDVPWHVMARGIETRQHFLFFYNKQCAYYLSKRLLAREEVEEVRRLMRAHLEDRARLIEG